MKPAQPSLSQRTRGASLSLLAPRHGAVRTTLLGLALFSPLSTSASEGPALPSLPEATTVTAEELISLSFRHPNLVLIDVRPARQFAERHLPEAVHYATADAWPSAGALAYYCETPSCAHAGAALRAQFRAHPGPLFHLRGGIDEWTGKGFPIVGPELSR